MNKSGGGQCSSTVCGRRLMYIFNLSDVRFVYRSRHKQKMSAALVVSGKSVMWRDGGSEIGIAFRATRRSEGRVDPRLSRVRAEASD